MTEFADSSTVLELDRVEVRHGTLRWVLSDLSLTIGRGELVQLVGPPGAGKSTLLRLMAALELPTSGRVLIAGQDVARLGRRARAHLRRQMGIVPQETELFDDCSVIDNVLMPAVIAGERRADSLDRASAALQRVGLDPEQYGALRCDRLAGGERRRVALARALSNRPALVLIDDPTGLGAQEALFETLDPFCRAGVTAVVAMREASPGATVGRRIELADGRLSA